MIKHKGLFAVFFQPLLVEQQTTAVKSDKQKRRILSIILKLLQADTIAPTFSYSYKWWKWCLNSFLCLLERETSFFFPSWDTMAPAKLFTRNRSNSSLLPWFFPMNLGQEKCKGSRVNLPSSPDTANDCLLVMRLVWFKDVHLFSWLLISLSKQTVMAPFGA